jgi:GT2 family glycosyltransferase
MTRPPQPLPDGRSLPRLGLTIIIVGWNGRERVRACLASIHAHPPRLPYEIILVDNASRDGTVESVRREFVTVTIITSPRNEGFQKANNRALKIARGEYIVLLNPDTEVGSGVFDTAAAFLDAHPDVAALSPRCVYPDGRLQWSVGIFPSRSILWAWCCAGHRTLTRLGARPAPVPAPDAARSQEQDYAYGAFFAVRRQAVEAAGPMDERFFLAGGDVAWSCEMRRHGWKVWYLAEATIVHHESCSRARVPFRSSLDWLAAHTPWYI